MGKYEPLADYLKDLSDDSWNATFDDIEGILGFELPPSAHEHRAWWANQYRGNHSQARGWIAAGWETREIDQRRGRVRFERLSRRPDRVMSDHALWRRAQEVTGIVDRKELEKAALAALIQRETADYVASLGGSMPDAEAAPRRRLS